jgi:tetratricopeptide (TPR) repeat protein
MSRSSDATNVFSIDRRRRRPDPARMSEFAETARRLQREREQEGERIARLLEETPREEWSALAELPSLHNSGVLDRLSAEVSVRLETEPRDALAMASLATAVAETLAPDAYPPVVRAQLRAHAWKDRAQALSYVGRHDDALESIERAETLAAPFGSLAHDRAIVRLVKAMTLQHLQRFEESLRLLDECRAVFLDHGDAKRQLHCGMAEGILLYRRREWERARDVFVPLLEAARSIGDLHSLAAAHSNIGHCSMDLGEVTVATLHFNEAMRNFQDMGDLTNALRVELGFARMLVKRGDLSGGLTRLEHARNQFLHHQMVEEAAICGLDIVAVLLETDRLAQARLLASRISTEYSGSPNVRGVSALQYLEERIEAHDAPAVVRHVSSYLESLRANPQLEFVGYA